MTKSKKSIRFDVSFNELLNAVLQAEKTHYITRIPSVILTEWQKEVQKFLIDCASMGYSPTKERLREKFTYIIQDVNENLDILYSSFTQKAREEYIANELIKRLENGTEGFLDDLEEIERKSVIPDTRIIDYNNFDRRLYDLDIKSMSWHIPYMDEMTDKLVGGDFVVILAPTKVGKTTFIKLAAQQAYDNKENVMFASQEQSVIRMTQQFDMQRLGLPHNKLRHGIDKETKEKLLKLQGTVKKKDSNIYIVPRVSSVRQLHDYVSSCPVKPDKIFIDGLNLMQGDFSSEYSSLAQTCSELKDYANEHNICIIVVTQTNRTGAKSGNGMNETHIAGSFAIAMYADFLISFSPMPETNNGVKRNHVYIRATLNRHGEANSVKVRMTPIYDKVRDKFTVEFALLPSDWSPDVSNIGFAARKRVATEFEEATGMKFSELSEDAQNDFLLADNASNDISEDF